MSTASEQTRKRGFLRSVLLIAGATSAGQGLSLIASPLITRLFSPAEFGVLGFYTSALNIGGAVSMLKYEVAVPLPETDAEAAHVFALSAIIAALNSLLLLAIVVACRSWLSSWSRTAILAPYLTLLPLGMFTLALYQALSAWAIRRREYRALAQTRINQNIVMLAAQVGLGFLGRGAFGLIVGHIAGVSGAIGTLVPRVLLPDLRIFRKVVASELRIAAAAYARFPKFSMAATLLNSTAHALPVFYFGAFFGLEMAGVYALVQRILFAPSDLLTASVSNVYFAEICHLRRGNDVEGMKSLFFRLFRQMLLFGVMAGVLAFILAPLVIPSLFGKRWANAAVCIQILSPMLAMLLAAGPLGGTLDALQRQDLHLARELIRAVLIVSGLGASYVSGADWIHTLIILSISGTLAYASYAGISWIAMRSSFSILRYHSNLGIVEQ